MKKEPRQPPIDPQGVDLPRLYAFSDGVFAIAITLLVLEIRFPELEQSAVSTQFWPTLAATIPAIFGFVQSFLIIGLFWTVHQRVFRLIKRGDNGLLWLNLLYLLLVAFLPVPSGIVSRYPVEPATMSFYVACVALLGLTHLLLWRYASHKHRLIDTELEPLQIRIITLRALALPLVCFVALGLYLVWPYMVYAFGSLIAAAYFLVGRVSRRAARRSG